MIGLHFTQKDSQLNVSFYIRNGKELVKCNYDGSTAKYYYNIFSKVFKTKNIRKLNKIAKDTFKGYKEVKDDQKAKEI